MDKQQRAMSYLLFLQAEGYSARIDEDGDVVYKKEGRTYFVDVDEKDDQFFRICFPNFWKIDSEEERQRVLVACDYSNALSKVAKVFIVRDNVWASIELFFGDEEHFKPVFERCMSALENGVRNYVKKMNE